MNRATEMLPKSVRLWATSLRADRTQIRSRIRSLAPVLLGIILLVAAAFRLTGINWDSNKHLHPDERFLTSVANDIKWPQNLDTYFDPQASPLSPYSLPTMGFYVYGTLPLWLVKAAAILLNADNYDAIAIVGRATSAVFDLAALWMLYLFGRRLYGEKVALLGAAFLALSVLNIQQAHFFTTDTFANLFVVLSLFLALRICERGHWADYALSGLVLGAGLASKLSVVTLIVPIGLAAGWDLVRQLRERAHPAPVLIERMVVRLLTFGVLTLLTFRVLQPIAFQGPEFWNFSLNKTWLDDIDEQSRILSGDIDAPPWHQWTNRSALLFPLQNMLLWGLGLPLGLAGWAGWGLATYELIRKRRWSHLLPVAYVGVTFLYHGTLWVKFMRYFLPIYPFLALFAAYLLIRSYGWIVTALAARTQARDPAAPEQPRQRLARISLPLLAALPAAVVLIGTFGWAAAFTSIYTRTHSRVAASYWMYDNIPPGSVLANEHWDDWLPLGMEGNDPYGQKTVTGVEMPNFDDDNPDKLNRMLDSLTKANYVILSSNRLYDSIPRLPMRYPMTTRYYDLLFSGQLGFTRVAEFTSYPQLFGIQFPDQSSEEAFTVYDHPRVQIFQKQPDYTPERARALLSDGIDWNAVVHLTPKQASKVPDLLQFTRSEMQRYQQMMEQLGPAPWAGLASTLPLLFWALTLTLIWLAALPLTLVVLSRLRDRGLPLARTIGLLGTAWLAWVWASGRYLPFTWWSALLALIALAVVSWLVGYAQRTALLGFWREQRRTILLQEGLFWGCFLAFVAVRWLNPDLWHPGLGGEKPMDTAYLNAVASTPFFPSYDPWYAGGFMNYYYFGFVLVATLIHLSGVEVTTAYNLAVPTLFALTAAGASSVAGNLAMPSRLLATRNWFARMLTGPRGWFAAGLLGALFVAGMGNLGQVQLLWDGLQQIGTQANPAAPPADPGPTTGLGMLARNATTRGRELVAPIPRAVDGLLQVAFNAKSFNFRQEWWYWNATRVYPAGKDEAGPITEFPLFTFLFADLHAHMMVLPLTVLVLALALQFLREGEDAQASNAPELAMLPLTLPFARTWLRTNWPEVLTLGTTALAFGALWPTNTWDVPTYMAVIAGALALRAVATRHGRIDPATLWAFAWRVGLVVGLGFLLFKPFHDYSASAYFGAEAWKGSRTPLWAYLIVHGFFLFVLISALVHELTSQRDLSGPARLLGVALRRRGRLARLRALYRRIVHPQPVHELVVALAAPALVGIVLLGVAGHLPEALALLVAGLALLVGIGPQPNPRRQFSALLIALGALLTAVVEVIVLKGDISRMNTVFKFYLQVWVMWGVAAAAALPGLAERLGQVGRPRMAALSNRWWPAFALLLAGCLLYPITAIPGRIKDRFDGVTVATLDGTAYMRTATYVDQDQPIVLESDRAAMAWMREHLKGRPTIVEANTPLYRWGSRVSIYTGFPTVIGWDWHQKQQRSILPGDYIDHRIEDVRAIYTITDPQAARQLLDRYDVTYIYLGKNERIYYGGDGLNKFDQYNGQFWDKIYENADVQIYQVRRS